MNRLVYSLLVSTILVAAIATSSAAEEMLDHGSIGVRASSAGTKVLGPLEVDPMVPYTATLSLEGLAGADTTGIEAWESSLIVEAFPDSASLIILSVSTIPESAFNAGSGTDFQVGLGGCDAMTGGQLDVAEVTFLVTENFESGRIRPAMYKLPSNGLRVPGVVLCEGENAAGIPSVSELQIVRAVQTTSICPNPGHLEPILQWQAPNILTTELIEDLVFDAEGNLYVTIDNDTDNSQDRLVKYSAYGDQLASWPVSDDGTQSGYRFTDPRRIVVNPQSGNLIVQGMDQVGAPSCAGAAVVLNETLRVFNPSGQFVRHFTLPSGESLLFNSVGRHGLFDFDALGQLVLYSFCGDNSDPGVSNYLGFGIYDFSTGVLLDSFDTQLGDPLTAPCYLGQDSWDLLALSNGLLAFSEAQPTGGDIYDGQNRIRVLDPIAGACAYDIGQHGDDEGQFRAPFGAVEGSDGRLYVGDVGRLQVFTVDGGFLGRTPNEGDNIQYRRNDVFVNGGEDFVGTFEYQASGTYEFSVFTRGIEFINIMGTSLLTAAHEPRTDDMSIYDFCVDSPPETLVLPVEEIGADGVSMALVRLELPQATTVTLSLDDFTQPGNTVGIGTLAPLSGGPQETTVVLQTVDIGGRHYLLAVYTAPDEFQRNGFLTDSVLKRRGVEFHLSVGAVSSHNVGTLQVRRPPVILVHGIFSRSEMWDNFQGFTTPSIWEETKKIRYNDTHGFPLGYNTGVVQEQFAEFWEEALLPDLGGVRGITGQFDVVAHSMGGLLVRRFAQDEPNEYEYRNPMNLGQGWINRLALLNVPHGGSPLADAVQDLVDAADNSLLGSAAELANGLVELLASIQGTKGSQYRAGALEELRTGSPALASLPRAEVLNRSYVGAGGFSWLQSGGLLPGTGWAGVITLLSETGPPSLLTQLGVASDLVVSVDSQRQLLPEMSIQEEWSVTHGLHWSAEDGSSESAAFSQQVTQLSVDANPEKFATEIPSGFGKHVGSSPPKQSWIPDLNPVAVELQLLPTNLPLRYGESIAVRASIPSQVQIDRVLLLSEGGGQVLTTQPYEATFDVPSSAGTEFAAAAVVIDVAGNISLSRVESLPLSTSTANLDDIILSGSPYILDTGAAVRLSLIGVYGATRHPIPISQVTSLSVEDPSVAAVSSEGWLVGLAPGTTTLSVSYGPTIVANVNVRTSQAENNLPAIRASSVVSGCAGEEVCVSVAASDPDAYFGDSIDLTWDLDGDGQFDDGTGTTVCVTKSADQADVLRVRGADTHGGAVEERVVVLQRSEEVCSPNVLCILDASAGGLKYVLDPQDVECDENGVFAIGDSGSREIVFVSDACASVSRVPVSADVDLSRIAMTREGKVWAGHSTTAMLQEHDQAGPFGPSWPFSPPGLDAWSVPVFFAAGNDQGLFPYLTLLHCASIGGDQSIVRQVSFLSYASWNSASSGYGEIAPDSELAVAGDLVFVADSDRVVRLRYSGSVFSEEGVWGTYGTDDGQFMDASDITTDRNGRLLVLDSVQKEIQEFTFDGVHVRTLNLPQYTGLTFTAPSALAMSPNGVVAVVDAAEAEVALIQWPSPATAVPEVSDPTSSEFRARVEHGTGGVVISLSMGRMNGPATIRVFDVRGRRIQELPISLRDGSWEGRWDMADTRGARVASGMYLLEAEVDGRRLSTKVAVLR